MEKLSKMHQKINEEFPWPTDWPKDLAETIDLWTNNPPFEKACKLHEPATAEAIEQEEKDLDVTLPSDYKEFLLRHDGITFPWSGWGHNLVAPIAALGLVWGDYQQNLEEVIEEIKEDGGEDEINDTLFYNAEYEIPNLDLMFPFGRDSTGDSYLIYLGAKSQIGEFPVFRFSHVGEFKLTNSSFAYFLWYLCCEAHSHPQENDPRLDKFYDREITLTSI